MTLRSRYRSWLRRWRWKRAVRRQNTPLREFVYLDDVSVYSLYASRRGPIATELTETEAASLQSEVTASTGISAIMGKADVGSRIQAENSRGTQVVRKSIIQTTFKELYDLERESFVLRPVDEAIERVPYKSIDDLERAAQAETSDGWLLNPTSLQRGDLVELEVELEAEPIYQAGAVISGVLDLLEDNPAMYGVQNVDELADVRAVNRMLERLLAGLVPVRGRAVDYRVVEIGGKEWIVHRNALAQLEGTSALQTRPLFLAGVAEHSLFWKDIRRVLFTGSCYRILARLSRDGIHAAWTPIKLADVLRSVVPDVAGAIDNANSGILAAMTGAPIEDPDATRSEMMRDALASYGLGLTEAMGRNLNAEEIVQVAALDRHGPESLRSVATRRQAFAQVTRFVEDHLGLAVDPTTAANCRTAALIEAGFTLDGQVATLLPAVEPGQPSTQTDERFLDSELVAIYW
jgi:hypothetical protein